MPAPDGRDATAALSREVDDVLDFCDGFGLDVQLGRRVKSSCPGTLRMVCYCAERDGRRGGGSGYGGVHDCSLVPETLFLWVTLA